MKPTKTNSHILIVQISMEVQTHADRQIMSPGRQEDGRLYPGAGWFSVDALMARRGSTFTPIRIVNFFLGEQTLSSLWL